MNTTITENQPMTSVFDTFQPGNVKAAMANAGAKSSDLWMVPYAGLRVAAGFNARLRTPAYEAKVAWLTEQMIAKGYLREAPLTGYVVKEDGADVVYVTAGHRRYEAIGRAIAAGAAIERVPVITHPAGASVEDLTVKLVTENNGEPLAPLEVATVCKRLQGYGLEDKEIAQRLGYTMPYLSQLFGLLAAPKVVRDMVAAGQVSATLASATVRKHGANASKKLADAVKSAAAKGKAKATQKDVEPSAPRLQPMTPEDISAAWRDANGCTVAYTAFVEKRCGL